MKYLRFMAALAIVPCLITTCSLTAAEEKTMPTPVPQAELDASAKATLVWLDKLDKGQYAESWEAASDLLKLTVSKQDWIELMTKTRKPLGSVNSRQVVDQRIAKNPKGLPAGDYIVMVYKTAFANKPAANELVTLLQQKGQWFVLTYQEAQAQ